MRHRLSIVLLAFFAAVPAFARVISYAPYTNRTATPGTQERTTRHFALIESLAATGPGNELVLYDTEGSEPRVALESGSGSWITHAALYEKSSARATPMLLALRSGPDGLHAIFSGNGGLTWTDLEPLRNKYVRGNTYWSTDTGGPWVRGLTAPIRIGSDEWPFVASFDHGVWAIGANGSTKLLAPAPALVVGQNRNGSRFLISTNGAMSVVGIDGATTSLGVQFADFRVPYGWITDDGSVYIQHVGYDGRYLYLHRNNTLEFLSGPYDAPVPSPSAPIVNRDPMSFFAVPTHDFNGAWMIHRDPTRPTKLSRHLSTGGGIETMWSDVSGPEVEALIAGASGQNLLVQVHRDRSAAVLRAFIDPALAVWRVGDPAPRAYDELYLNEEVDKGFVHVDVDQLAAGKPFVFSSGTFQPFLEGPVSPPVPPPPSSGGGDVIQEWGVVRASLKQRLVLPGVARLRGAFNSHWLTDVTIYNPSDDPQDVEVRFVALGEQVQAASGRSVTITLAPHEIRFVPDALHALFAVGDGGGALHFLPAAGINVVGRTYSRNATGTFGFGMQAIDFFNAAGSRFPMTFAGAFPGEHFRTNVLLTDTSGHGTEASLRAYGVSGPLGGALSGLSSPAGGILQYNGIGPSLGVISRDAGGMIVQPTRGTAIATVVAIDNRTNDPTWFPPDLPTTSNMIRAIPVIGHLDGAHGSRFRSDIYLFNPTNLTRTIALEAKDWAGPATKITQFTLLPNEARVIVDALPTLFQMTGLARLRYWTNDFGDGVRVTSRTYTVDESGATYGSLVPPLNSFQIATPGDNLEILGVNGSTGFRTNVGLVDLSPANQSGSTGVRIRVIDNQRRQLDTFTVTVPRSGGMQINDIFASRGVPTPAAALLIIEVMDGGPLGAYATLTDNATNDSTYLGANLGAQPN